MKDQQFKEETYFKIKEAIFQIDEKVVDDIYAISFCVCNYDEDLRQPMLIFGYNTLDQWKSSSPLQGQKAQWPIASSSEEAKWNYAFWLQNEELIIGGDSNKIVSDWVKSTPYYFSDELLEDDFDKALLLGEKIQDAFIQIMLLNAQKLYDESVIKSKFGKEIPIIVHELEYSEMTVSWTNQANPNGLGKDFEKWITSM